MDPHDTNVNAHEVEVILMTAEELLKELMADSRAAYEADKRNREEYYGATFSW